jgi:hypothetical protein
MGCRPIVLGPGRVRILREPPRATAVGRARDRHGDGRFAATSRVRPPSGVATADTPSLLSR